MYHKYKIALCECEHNGDLDAYCDDIIYCGGTIEGAWLSEEDYEIGFIEFTVKDRESFLNKFKNTETYLFVC